MEWKRWGLNGKRQRWRRRRRQRIFLPSTWKHSVLAAAAAAIDVKLSLASWWCDRDRCALTHLKVHAFFLLYGVAIFSHSLSLLLSSLTKIISTIYWLCIRPYMLLSTVFFSFFASFCNRADVIMNVIRLHPIPKRICTHTHTQQCNSLCGFS